MLDGGLEPTLYFYNPNIDSAGEYEKRKAEAVRYAAKMNVPFVDHDGDRDLWNEAVRGYEPEPERGKRCSVCFEMRLAKTAAYAAENGFRVFTTSLGISRWKDFEQVTRAGRRVASLFPGLVYWEQNWRLRGGQEQMEQISKEEAFYRQKYCGCVYSLRESIQRSLGKKSQA